MPIAVTRGRALQLTRDTPAPQGAKEIGVRTHSAPGHPQATEPGCGRAGKHKFRPSRLHRGRMARWMDPRATSAPRSHHHQHDISDDLIPRSKKTEKLGSSAPTQGKWLLTEAAWRSCAPPAHRAQLRARLQHVSKQILFAYGQGNWRGERKKKKASRNSLSTNIPAGRTCSMRFLTRVEGEPELQRHHFRLQLDPLTYCLLKIKVNTEEELFVFISAVSERFLW